jgi:ferredoxin-NADP reductase
MTARFENATAFVSILGKLTPRLYSIASSPDAVPGQVSLCVGAVRYTAQERQRGGVCSTFMADRLQAGDKVKVFVHSNKNFRLPENGNTPIIMVGPGTGIAPFRAFWQQRVADNAQGANWLFFGNPYKATDGCYEDEIAPLVESGKLRLSVAWSRDQAHKIYVQNLMEEAGAEIWQWLENGAAVYMCGDANRMAKDVEKALLAIISILAIRAVTLPGAAEGLKYYLVPDFGKMVEAGVGEVIFAALGQAFFTLSIGMGSMAIFGSYISRDHSLLGESIAIASLDTFVAFVAGLIIIPSCFAFGIDPGAGPGLIFQTLPNVFNVMPGGRWWGALFFLFMIFAAVSTVIAVFENIIAFGMDAAGWSRKKSCAINLVLIAILALPCAFGFNIWSGFMPFGEGSNVLDLEDFIISNNILPLGSLVYVLFCTSERFGWGWKNFLEEANAGNGLKFPKWLYVYVKFILPIILIVLWGQGIMTKFF